MVADTSCGMLNTATIIASGRILERIVFCMVYLLILAGKDEGVSSSLPLKYGADVKGE
jgi:hypothetical protein